MDPGERVTSIQLVGRRLAEMGDADANLTLYSFGCRQAVLWDKDTYEGVVEVLADEPDEHLLSLREHVTGERLATDPGQTTRLWPGAGVRLFLSHLWIEREFVAEVAGHLANQGVQSFVAHRDIEPTREWVDEIHGALASCHACAAFLHDGFEASPWTDQEVGHCIGRGVPILPIRVGGLMPYGFMGRYQAVPGDGHPRGTAIRIVEALIRNDRTQPIIAPTLVEHLISASTLLQTQNWLGRVEAVRLLPPPAVDLLALAVSRNSNIGDDPELRDRVTALLTRHGYSPATPDYDGEEPF